MKRVKIETYVESGFGDSEIIDIYKFASPVNVKSGDKIEITLDENFKTVSHKIIRKEERENEKERQ